MSIRKAICAACRNFKAECICDITCDECGNAEAQCVCGRDSDPYGNTIMSEREWRRELENIMGMDKVLKGKYTLGES